MVLSLTLTIDERHASRRASVYLQGLAAGLRGSHDAEAAMCEEYAATLARLGSSDGPVRIEAEQKLHVEQGAFLLEGIRNGFDNADLDLGADAVERDIQGLTDITLRYNTEAGRQL